MVDVVIPGDEATEAYGKVETRLAAEWAIIKTLDNAELTEAHSRLHYKLKHFAEKYGVIPPVQTDAPPGDKPPRPS